MIHPMVRQELKDRGFDGYVGWDTLENTDIEIAVPFDIAQVLLPESKTGNPGHPAGAKRGTRYTPWYSVFVRRKVTKQKPEWYRHSS